VDFERDMAIREVMTTLGYTIGSACGGALFSSFGFRSAMLYSAFIPPAIVAPVLATLLVVSGRNALKRPGSVQLKGRWEDPTCTIRWE
jgi:predicted MFS family arabinose efflux permease